MHLTYAKLLAIVVHENMKLGDNTLNNERLTLVNTKFLPKYWRIVALILLPYNISIILKLKGHIKGRLISRILIFLKNLSSGLKIKLRTKPITKCGNVHCDWFILPLLFPTPTIWFSLDHKRKVSDGVVSGVVRNGNVLILLTPIPSRL